MSRFNITLLPNLTQEQKILAYSIMGYILITYSRDHCVDSKIVDRLLSESLIDFFEITPVNVMYNSTWHTDHMGNKYEDFEQSIGE